MSLKTLEASFCFLAAKYAFGSCKNVDLAPFAAATTGIGAPPEFDQLIKKSAVLAFACLERF